MHANGEQIFPFCPLSSNIKGDFVALQIIPKEVFMADQKQKKKPASSANSKNRVTVTNREDTDKPRASKSGGSAKSSTGKNPKNGKSTSSAKKTAEAAAPNERKLNFMRNFMPYILGAISLFLAVCFIVDLFFRDVSGPGEHGMGVLGYYICRALFGCLSWVAFLIPATLATLTIFWQRYFQTGRVIGKIVLAITLLLILSSVTHVFFMTGSDAELRDIINPADLFKEGASFRGGGVLGGLLGFVLYWALRLPGTLVLALITLPLVIMGLIGVTPRQVFGKLWGMIRGTEEERRKRRVEREERNQERRAEAEKNRETRRTEREARRAEKADEDDTEDDSAPDEDEDDEDVIRINSKTGEVMDAAHGKRSTKQKKRQKNVAEDSADEEFSTLPLNDTRAADPVEEPAEEDARPDPNEIPTASQPRRHASTTDPRHASAHPQQHTDKSELPWEESDEEAPVSIARRHEATAQDTGDTYEDEEDADPQERMEVGFDDDPDAYEDNGMAVENEFIPTRISGRHTSYEVVTDSETAPADSRRTGEPVSVRILKSDPSAVAERGLSDEEIVLPSGSDSEAEEIVETREYQFPSVDMLTRGPSQYATNDEEIAENTQILRDVLESFRIGVREIECSCGPTITRFEVRPDTGVRVRSIANLVDDIAMGLAKAGGRIEAPIPGKSAVGIEVPNAEPSTVYLRNILETPEFRNHKSRIAACLGADVSGRPVILDINKMPHLLIAGATGTGKSVCINSLVMSILYKAKPDEVKLILIDPKKVEFAMYRDLPHLYAPVVSDPKKAAGALNSAVNEMERRFELIEEVGVRNLAGYNEITAGDPERPPLPQMVIIIDELADLMMTAPAEVETAICRLAQKARAAGIHLVIGTQRPSVDVITGLIKANVPSRIAFTVKSGVDSRTILDTVGADKLIGRGDMLYAPIGSSKPMRVQGAFVSESEVEKVVSFIKDHNDPPEYNEDFTRSIDVEAAKCGSKKKGEQMSLDDFGSIGGARNDGEDPKFWEALEIAVTKDKIGTSALQRACNLGYGRAAKIIDRMEELGFVGRDDGTKQGRKVLITKQDFIQYKLNGLPTFENTNEDEDDASDV